jgi:hypothetical protein
MTIVRAGWFSSGCCLLGLLTAAPAAAGGSFDTVVGVGDSGHWRAIALARNGPRSDASLAGHRASVPSGGYVRVFLLIGGLPGIPGRYYPGVGTLCLSWREPPRHCNRLTFAGRTLLAPLALLPLRRGMPTVAARVRPFAGVLNTANVRVALELALERHPRPARVPVRGRPIEVVWRGPAAKARPRRLLMGPRGVYVGGQLYQLPPGVWSYVAAN